MAKIDQKKYVDFVRQVTSKPSLDSETLVERLEELDENANVPQLLTAALGVSAEAGEFTEIVKKIAFQGKELNDDTKTHLVKEMGDVFWYLAQACLALNVDFQTVVMTNMMKLAARYPDGKFDISKSEVRKEGDI